MAYNKEDLYNKALEVIKKHNPIFIEEIVSYMPCDKTTFYRYFPINSNEYNDIKVALEDNIVNVKGKLRKKWQDSENATLQMGLMKLISSDEERRRLSQSNVDHTTKGDKIESTPVLSFFKSDEDK